MEKSDKNTTNITIDTRATNINELPASRTSMPSDQCPHQQSCYERMETLQQHAGRQAHVQQHNSLRIWTTAKP